METEIIDKLFLELSQFTTAKTHRQIALERDIAHWVQLAKYQRDWFAANHPDKTNAGPCPTAAAIEQSEKLIGRKIGYPKVKE